MRHKRKCIEKRMYQTTDAAMNSILHMYMKKGIILKTYECHICLAFHLTSQPWTPPWELRRWLTKMALKRWFPHWKRMHVNDMIAMRESQFRKRYGLNSHGSRIGIKGTMKPVILPLVQQKEALKQLAN